MEWTKERPTEPGWYWMRRPGEDLQVVEVRQFNGGLKIMNHEQPYLSKDLNDPRLEQAEWAGPLKVPE